MLLKVTAKEVKFLNCVPVRSTGYWLDFPEFDCALHFRSCGSFVLLCGIQASSAAAVPHAAGDWTVKRPDDLRIAGAHLVKPKAKSQGALLPGGYSSVAAIELSVSASCIINVCGL